MREGDLLLAQVLITIELCLVGISLKDFVRSVTAALTSTTRTLLLTVRLSLSIVEHVVLGAIGAIDFNPDLVGTSHKAHVLSVINVNSHMREVTLLPINFQRMKVLRQAAWKMSLKMVNICNNVFVN